MKAETEKISREKLFIIVLNVWSQPCLLVRHTNKRRSYRTAATKYFLIINKQPPET